MTCRVMGCSLCLFLQARSWQCNSIQYSTTICSKIKHSSLREGFTVETLALLKRLGHSNSNRGVRYTLIEQLCINVGIEIAEKVKKQESSKPAGLTHRDLYLDSMDMVETKEKTVF